MFRSACASIASDSFIKRSLSSLILGPLTLFLLYMGGPYNQILLGLFFLLSLTEWWRLCFIKKAREIKAFRWFLGGFIYISVGFASLSILGQINAGSLVGILLIIWASDTGAYLVGSIMRGPKLLPKISPNKTWSGMVGGILFSMFSGYLLLQHTQWQILSPAGEGRVTGTMFFVGAIALISPIGDLLESWIKRRFAVKDSGRLIPGHGGILDRLDSLIAVGVALFIFMAVNMYSKIISFSHEGQLFFAGH